MVCGEGRHGGDLFVDFEYFLYPVSVVEQCMVRDGVGIGQTNETWAGRRANCTTVQTSSSALRSTRVGTCRNGGRMQVHDLMRKT